MHYLYKMNSLLVERVLAQLQGEENDDRRFSKYFVAIFKKLRKLDQMKHLEPKFGNNFSEMAMYIMKNKDELLGNTNSIDSNSFSGISEASQMTRISRNNTKSPNKPRMPTNNLHSDIGGQVVEEEPEVYVTNDQTSQKEKDAEEPLQVS